MIGSKVKPVLIVGVVMFLGIFAPSCQAGAAPLSFDAAVRAKDILKRLHAFQAGKTPQESIELRKNSQACVQQLFSNFEPKIIDVGMRMADKISNDCQPSTVHPSKLEFLRSTECYNEVSKLLEGLWNCVKKASMVKKSDNTIASGTDASKQSP